MDLKDLKSKHKGGEIAILANGQSLYQDVEDLKIDKIPTIGINASWSAYKATYHLALDYDQIEKMAREDYDHPAIIIGNHKYPVRPKNHYTVGMKFDKKLSFSTDIIKNGLHVCMSSVWAGLQVGNLLLGGEGNIYLMGFDLGGSRVEGHPKKEWRTLYEDNRTRIETKDPDLPNKSIQAQYELMGYLRGLIDQETIGIKVFISHRSKSIIRSIPRVAYLTRGKHPERLYQGADDQLKTIPIDKKTYEWMMRQSTENPGSATRRKK